MKEKRKNKGLQPQTDEVHITGCSDISIDGDLDSMRSLLVHMEGGECKDDKDGSVNGSRKAGGGSVVGV
jgi:hypothetical protein